MTEKKKIALIVTGSVAAGKTLELVEELQKDFPVDVIFTKAPEQWQFKPRWMPLESVRGAIKGSLVIDSDPMAKKAEIIGRADILLVAPATADFISQLAFRSSDLACAMMDAHSGGAILCLAPAMNVKIWGHPSVQRNCASLIEKNIFILGPVEGAMACNDFGFGRMMSAGLMAECVRRISQGNAQDSAAYNAARQAAGNKKRPPQKAVKTILAVIIGHDIEWPDIETFVVAAKEEGLSVQYVLDQKWLRYREALKLSAGQPAVTDHYQCDPEGLEHIRLPEKADLVVFPFVDKNLAEQMVRGGSKSLGTDIYLASKAPVAVIASTRSAPNQQTLEVLRSDGILIISHPKELRSYPVY